MEKGSKIRDKFPFSSCLHTPHSRSTALFLRSELVFVLDGNEDQSTGQIDSSLRNDVSYNGRVCCPPSLSEASLDLVLPKCGSE